MNITKINSTNFTALERKSAECFLDEAFKNNEPKEEINRRKALIARAGANKDMHVLKQGCCWCVYDPDKHLVIESTNVPEVLFKIAGTYDSPDEAVWAAENLAVEKSKKHMSEARSLSYKNQYKMTTEEILKRYTVEEDYNPHEYGGAYSNQNDTYHSQYDDKFGKWYPSEY